MENLIQDLLTYTTAINMSAGGRPEWIRVRRSRPFWKFKGPLEQAGAVVTLTALPVVAMHESRPAQVFQNLIGNALRYRIPAAPGCIFQPASGTAGARCR